MSQLPLYTAPYDQALSDLLQRMKTGFFKVETREVKAGDFVQYPVGFTTVIDEVFEDENKDVYVKCVTIPPKTYIRYIYKKNPSASWDTRLCMELGFKIVDKPTES